MIVLFWIGHTSLRLVHTLHHIQLQNQLLGQDRLSQDQTPENHQVLWGPEIVF